MSELDATPIPSQQDPIEQDNPEYLRPSSNPDVELSQQPSEINAKTPDVSTPKSEVLVVEEHTHPDPPVQGSTNTATPIYPSSDQSIPTATSPEPYQPQPMQPEYVQQQNPMPVQPQQPYIPQQPQATVQPTAYMPAQLPTSAGNVQAPIVPKSKNGKAIASLVCGILAIINSGTIVLGIILGVIAIILGVLAKKDGKSGMSTGGLVCGIVGIVISFIMVIAIAFALGSLSQANDPDRMIEDFLDSVGAGHNIVETTPGYVVTDDQVCTIKLTGTDIDADGNLNVYFDMTNHTVTELDVYTDSLHPWTINGVKADCVAFSWVDPDETKTEQCLTIPADYLPDNVKKVDDVWGLHGTLIVQLTNIEDEMFYEVVL